MREHDLLEKEEIFFLLLRAGRRTYFFDVRSTKADDYYITITESKKTFDNEGSQNFEKHKIFLYKEDFEKFAEGLEEVVAYIKKAFKDSGREYTEMRPKERDTNF